jgi:hypothetical protein
LTASGDVAAELVLDANADDLLEAGVGLNPSCSVRLAVNLHGCHDLFNERIGLAADAGYNLVAVILLSAAIALPRSPPSPGMVMAPRGPDRGDWAQCGDGKIRSG